MAKIKTSFFCQNCGAKHSSWMGKCANCNEWNTIVEEVIQKSTSGNGVLRQNGAKPRQPYQLSGITYESENRVRLIDEELNRILGGGLVKGSITLIGGEPGIGKSTLLLQVGLQENKHKILYVSGEESEQQVKMRADRIGINNIEFLITTETRTQNIIQTLEESKPDILIIDSIQTLHTAAIESAPGSVTQVRECTYELTNYAKATQTPVLLIGHVTKDGFFAGPKVLEHMVDTVLYFEGDRNHTYRILRAVKNRFGSTSELGIYEMINSGLKEIKNPSDILLSQRDEMLSGISVAATVEGVRPLLIEVQALVSSAVYGTPQRSATGFDLRRLSMLLAVLEKRCGFKLAAKDVFLNIAGGFRVDDPAIDLAVVCSILSSSEDIPISPKVCFASEIGLSGEIRPVSRIEQRISEAEKLGFDQIFISKYNEKGLGRKFNIDIVKVRKIEDVFTLLFG